MHHPTTVARPANQSLARVLAHAIDAGGKPRHRIASECGMHRETLLRVARGERPKVPRLPMDSTGRWFSRAYLRTAESVGRRVGRGT